MNTTKKEKKKTFKISLGMKNSHINHGIELKNWLTKDIIDIKGTIFECPISVVEAKLPLIRTAHYDLSWTLWGWLW